MTNISIQVVQMHLHFMKSATKKFWRSVFMTIFSVPISFFFYKSKNLFETGNYDEKIPRTNVSSEETILNTCFFSTSCMLNNHIIVCHPSLKDGHYWMLYRSNDQRKGTLVSEYLLNLTFFTHILHMDYACPRDKYSEHVTTWLIYSLFVSIHADMQGRNYLETRHL